MYASNLGQQIENLLTIVAIAAAAGLGLVVLRFILKLAAKIFRIGCGAMVVIGVGLILVYGVWPLLQTGSF